jgi:hypothetical protein
VPRIDFLAVEITVSQQIIVSREIPPTSTFAPRLEDVLMIAGPKRTTGRFSKLIGLWGDWLFHKLQPPAHKPEAEPQPEAQALRRVKSSSEVPRSDATERPKTGETLQWRQRAK